MSKWGSGMGLVIVAAAAFGVWQLDRTQKKDATDAETVDAVPEVTVQTASIVQTNLHASVIAYGSVEPDPGHNDASSAKARITAPVSGLVAEVLCAEGGSVKRGDVLFRMDGRLAALAIAKALQAVEFAEKGVARQKKLLLIDGTSEKVIRESQQQLDAARQELVAAQTERDLLSVTAPVAGTVIQINAHSGETVDAGRDLAEVADLKRLVLVATLPSREADLIKEGMTAQIDGGEDTVPSLWPAGAVTYIDPRIDPQTDTVKLRVGIPASAALRPGQYARVRIIYADLKDRLAVPEEGLERTDEGLTVLKVVEGNEAVLKPVKSGVRDGEWVEVQGEGIASGMRIVTVGGYGLQHKTRIREITP